MRRGSNRRGLVSLVALIACGAIGVAVASGADLVDRGFGVDGFVETPVPLEADGFKTAPAIWDLASAPDGSIVAAVADLSTETSFFGAARYGADGALDRGFGRDGLTVPLAGAQAQAVAVQPDGKIVEVGYRTRSRFAPLVARLDVDGSLDASFGVGGVQRLRRAYRDGIYNTFFHDVAIQPSGRIVVVGATDEEGIGKSRGPRPAGVVVAYTPDGRIDRSFGNRGRVFFPARGNDREYTGLKSIELQPDGKILVSGFRFGSLFVARLGPNGRLDRSFGGGTGMVRRFFGSRQEGCSRVCWSAAPVAVRPDGRIVLFVSNFPDGSRLVQLLPNGRLDPSFGSGGVTQVRTRLNFSLQGFDMVLQGEQIALAVWGEEPPPQKPGLLFSVARYLSNGQLDTGFGDNGVATHRVRSFGAAFAALSQPGERLVIGGGSGEDRPAGGTDYYLELARFLPR